MSGVPDYGAMWAGLRARLAEHDDSESIAVEDITDMMDFLQDWHSSQGAGTSGMSETRHRKDQVLTPAEVAQIPPSRLRAIIAAGLYRDSMRKVASIEARLLGRVDGVNDESVE